MDDQMFTVDAHKGKLHNEWVQNHAAKAQMNHSCSRVKALLLVKEAERLEWIHLQHQRDHATFLIQRCSLLGKSASTANIGNMKDSGDCCSCFSPSRHTPSVSPPRGHQGTLAQSPTVADVVSPSTATNSKSGKSSSNVSTDTLDASSPVVSPSRRAAQQSFTAQKSASPSNSKKNGIESKNAKQRARSNSCPPPPSPVACGCLHVAAWRLMSPRCRVMALLKKHGEKGNLESIVDALRQTYTSDTEMVEDMDARYGPEPTAIDPELLLQSSIERMAGHKARWNSIREDVDYEMSCSPHAFQNVIRTLSVMRIFIEGSQGQSYGIDFTDRQRREASQQAVLAKLRANRALFMDQCASPSSKKDNKNTASSNSNNNKNKKLADNNDDDWIDVKKVAKVSSSAFTNKAR